ncbi:MAG: putative methyltransferase [Parcubacteria group bacterium]|nr:putative methyltransferase [Parcubacteria group bacterium]
MTEMKPLPEAEIYERGLGYWPYRDSLQTVLNYALKAPEGCQVLDIMCGTGYLLGEIGKARPDLSLMGVDIDERYVEFGRKRYAPIEFHQGDVRYWCAVPRDGLDMVLCTGALHHVPYEDQGVAIANIARMLKPDGVAVISDCYVDDYTNEEERCLAAAKLGYEYLKYTIEAGAPDEVLGWTVDILMNDVLRHEYKPSFKKRLPLLERHFRVTTKQLWPHRRPNGYGDYVHICVPR